MQYLLASQEVNFFSEYNQKMYKERFLGRWDSDLNTKFLKYEKTEKTEVWNLDLGIKMTNSNWKKVCSLHRR